MVPCPIASNQLVFIIPFTMTQILLQNSNCCTYWFPLYCTQNISVYFPSLYSRFRFQVAIKMHTDAVIFPHLVYNALWICYLSEISYHRAMLSFICRVKTSHYNLKHIIMWSHKGPKSIFPVELFCFDSTILDRPSSWND